MAILSPTRCVAGIDTHRDQHAVAILNADTGMVETREFSACPTGYQNLTAWLQAAGPVQRVGVEATGSYGAGVTRHLQDNGFEVLEVIAPCRTRRRRQGKDDTLDATSAAEAVLHGNRAVTAKTRSSEVETLRAFQAARAVLLKNRKATLQALRALIVSAPAELREQLRELTLAKLIKRCNGLRPDPTLPRGLVFATKTSLRHLARAISFLDQQLKELDLLIVPIVEDLAPSMLAMQGIKHQTAAVFLLTAGGNPDRIHSEASFAMLCGTAPLPASSGKVVRHRLNRGGDRRANSALHMCVLTKMNSDPETKAYIQRRQEEGKTKREAMRCVKRFLARRIYGALLQDHLISRSTDPSLTDSGSGKTLLAA